MRQLFFILLSSFAIVGAKAYAHQNGKNFGLGVVIGSPSMISAKFWVSGQNALDLGVFSDFNGSFDIFTDYLWHVHAPLGHPNGFLSRLIFFYGLGLYLDPVRTFALRVPLKLEYFIPTIPIGIGLELAPGLKVLRGMGLFLQGGVSFRIYF